MAWDIELHRFDNGALFAIGHTPRGRAWIADNSPVYDDGKPVYEDEIRLDGEDYNRAVERIMAAGLTVFDTTPTEGERASHTASQAARALTYL